MNNLEHLTDDEFIRHLDNTSNDPIVRRLVKIFQDNDDMVFQQLINAGMDLEGRFETECELLPVGEYIEHLRSEVAYYQDEIDDLESQLSIEKDKNKQLSARSIAEVMSELNSEIKRVDQQVRESKRNEIMAVEERDLAKEQLKMWNHLRDPA